MMLFGKTSPHDIKQGSLGNCWLLSAFACLAEYNGAIQKNFITSTCNIYGKYRIKLYDRRTKKWTVIVVDDRIPCNSNGGPSFAKCSTSSIWPLLLEKAFAKFCGSYAALEGGQTIWALEALTGDRCNRFSMHRDNQWVMQTMENVVKNPKTMRDITFRQQPNAKSLSNDDFKTFMFKMLRSGSILSCSVNGDDNQGNIKQAENKGLVNRHAYSLLDIKMFKKLNITLLKIRNPHGKGEWEGAWSDRSKLWREYPDVAKACTVSSNDPRDDGIFWMSWPDFKSAFRVVDFVFRTTGFGDLAIQEHGGCCGPVTGCMSGCRDYWCCCGGCKALCCATDARSTELDIEAKIHPGCCEADCTVCYN